MAVPTYQEVAAGVATDSGTTLTPAYPVTSLAAGDLFLLFIYVRDSSTMVQSVSGGFTKLFGPTLAYATNSHDTWIYYKVATGAESGTVTVTFDSATVCKIARMYRFRGSVDPTLFGLYEANALNSSNSRYPAPADIVASAPQCLGLAFISVNDDNSVGQITGGSDTWTQCGTVYTTTQGSDGAVHVQYCDLGSDKQATGGSNNMGAVDTWLVETFALRSKDVWSQASRGGKVTGIEASNDTRGAYISGVASSNDTRSASITGATEGTNVNDTRQSSIAGSLDSNDTRQSDIYGSESSNDTRQSYIAGSLDSNDVRQSSIIGSLDSSNTRQSSIQGSEDSSNTRQAETIGALTSNDVRLSSIIGLDSSNNSRQSSIAGSDDSNDTREGNITGVSGSNSTRNASIMPSDISNDVRQAAINGALSGSSTREASTIGEDSSNDTRKASIIGCENSNDARSASITGYLSSFDTRPSEIFGSLDSNDTRTSSIIGSVASSNTRQGSIEGEEALGSSSSTRNSSIEGQVEAIRTDVFSIESASGARAERDINAAAIGVLGKVNDTRAAEIIGSLDSNGTIQASISGKESSDDTRQASIIGSMDSSSTSNAEIIGSLDSSDTIHSEIHGSDESSDTRQSKVSGSLDSSNTRQASISGVLEANDTRNASITGESIQESTSTINASIAGSLDTNDTRNASITGKDTSSDTRNASIIGKLDSYDSRSASIAGSLDSSDTRQAKIYVHDESYSYRLVNLIGEDASTDTRPAAITGIGYPSSDTRQAGMNVIWTSENTRGAKILGGLNSDDARNAYVYGQGFYHETRKAKLIVKNLSFSSRKGKIIGDPTFSYTALGNDSTLWGTSQTNMAGADNYIYEDYGNTIWTGLIAEIPQNEPWTYYRYRGFMGFATSGYDSIGWAQSAKIRLWVQYAYSKSIDYDTDEIRFKEDYTYNVYTVSGDYRNTAYTPAYGFGDLVEGDDPSYLNDWGLQRFNPDLINMTELAGSINYLDMVTASGATLDINPLDTYPYAVRNAYIDIDIPLEYINSKGQSHFRIAHEGGWNGDYDPSIKLLNLAGFEYAIFSSTSATNAARRPRLIINYAFPIEGWYVEDLKQTDLSVNKALQDVINNSVVSGVLVRDGYPEDELEFDSSRNVSLEHINTIELPIELGSRLGMVQRLFAVDVVCDRKGELQDLVNVIIDGITGTIPYYDFRYGFSTPKQKAVLIVDDIDIIDIEPIYVNDIRKHHSIITFTTSIIRSGE